MLVYMDLKFEDDNLRRMYYEADFMGGFSIDVLRAFRKRVGFIAQARDDRDIRRVRGNRLEKLKGRSESSVRINDQWRLILTFKTIRGNRTAVLHGIKDYHH